MDFSQWIQKQLHCSPQRTSTNLTHLVRRKPGGRRFSLLKRRVSTKMLVTRGTEDRATHQSPRDQGRKGGCHQFLGARRSSPAVSRQQSSLLLCQEAGRHKKRPLVLGSLSAMGGNGRKESCPLDTSLDIFKRKCGGRLSDPPQVRCLGSYAGSSFVPNHPQALQHPANPGRICLQGNEATP